MNEPNVTLLRWEYRADVNVDGAPHETAGHVRAATIREAIDLVERPPHGARYPLTVTSIWLASGPLRRGLGPVAL